MSRASHVFQQVLQGLGSAVVSLLVWTLWLVLTITLGAQIYVITTSELAVPAWVLSSMEQRLASYGIHAKFGRTSFDPAGSVFVENAHLTLPSLNEPVITAGGIFVRFDPWSLVLGKFEARELRVTGASCLVPAMISPTGRTEQLVHDFDATIRPGGDGEIILDALSARLANLTLNARGTIYLPVQPRGAGKPLTSAAFIANRYTAFCRQLLVATEKLRALDTPSVEVDLDPSESRGAIASITLYAHGLKLDTPLAVQASGLRAHARFPLSGDAPVMVRLELAAEELRLPGDAIARGVQARMRGALRPALFAFDPTEIELTADTASAQGVSATAFAGRFTPGPLPRLHVDAIAQAMGAPLAVQADADFAAQSATFQFEGSLAPAWLDLISQRVKRNVRTWVDFATPITVANGTGRFGPHWRFEEVSARIHAENVNAYRVKLDDARGRIELTPKRFFAAEAEARLGNKNFAHGSYEHVFATKQFRFLLEGSLEPLAISGWFGPWWPNFFKNTFEFPGGPPVASVDVAGRWTEGWRTTVFVFADVNSPIIRGAKLDRARTLLFIRPGYFDGLETLGVLGTGEARGTFTYRLNPKTSAWDRFDFKGQSSLELEASAKLIGPVSTEWFAPFKFDRPPALKVDGHVRRDATGDFHHEVRIEGAGDSAFQFYGFPLERVAFNAQIHDDEIAIEDVVVGVANGVAKGTAKIRGAGAASRRLSFDFSLRDASLGRAVGALEQFNALREGKPIPAAGKFIQDKNNVRLDLAVTAEGNLADVFSYHGRGVADLAGAELGEVRLLGGLSEILRFTALRFTAVNANFRLEGSKLVFPEISVTGDNSAIHAHGEYALDRKELDFNGKVFPFQESGFILKKILDVALSPFSNVFEVKLTGTLDKPSWGLVLGPTNFLRTLQGDTPEKPLEFSPVPSAGPAPAPSAPDATTITPQL